MLGVVPLHRILHARCIHTRMTGRMSISRFASPRSRAKAATAAGRSRTPRIDKGNGGTVAYTEMRRRIVSLDLKPGADLDEASLVRDLGVSRTPVRSALVRLS